MLREDDYPQRMTETAPPRTGLRDQTVGGALRWPTVRPATARRVAGWSLPALFALAYVAAVTVDFGAIIHAIYSDSDTAIAPVIGHLMGSSPPGSQAVLGNHAWYEEYLFLRLTSGLPAYRQVWEIAPLLWSLAGVALLGWAAARALDGRAALVVVSALICVGAFGRLSFFTFDWHGLTAVHTIVVGAATVWLAERGGRISWAGVLGLALAIGLLGVLPASGDLLFLAWALVPLLVTAVAFAWRAPAAAGARMVAFALVVSAIALAGGAALASTLRAHGVSSLPFRYSLVSADRVVHNVVLLFQGYANIAGGDFFGAHVQPASVAMLISGLLVLAAIAAVLATVRSWVARAGPRPDGGDPEVGARFAYVCFWTACLLVTSAVFVLTSAPFNAASARYILGGYVAIAALVGLVAMRSRGWRLAVTAAVCVFALSATYQVLREPEANATGAPEMRDFHALERFAAAHQAGYGYASYWNAAELTWTTAFRLPIYPVEECGPEHTLCAGSVKISSWYVPRPHTNSLLIVDPNLPELPITGLDTGFGRPSATTTIAGLHVYVFAYDLAARLARRP